MNWAKLERFLLFATLLFLPTQLGKHFWPEFAKIFSLPIDYLSPTIYFWDLLVLALLVAFLFDSKKGVNKLALNLFLVFILSQVMAMLGAFWLGKMINIAAGLVRIEQWFIAGLFGVYLASQNLEQIKKRLYWALGVAVVAEAFLGIVEFLMGQTMGLWIVGERTFSLSTPGIAKFDFYGVQFLRPYATFPHPNVLAAFMLLTTLLLIGLALGKIRSSLISLSLMTATAFVTLLLTLSRTALGLGFLLTPLLLRKKGVILMGLLMALLSPFLYVRFFNLLNFDNLSLIRREELNGIAWQLFLDSPIFGIGLNNFIPAAADQLLVGPNRFLQPDHNIVLLTLCETGVVGLLGWISLLGLPIFKLVKFTAKLDLPKVLLIVWAFIFILGMFDHYFLTLPQGYRMVFLFWGLSLSVLEFKSAKNSEDH